MADETFVGVDLGGTITKVAVGDSSGKVLAERRIATRSQEGADAVLDRIAREAKAACAEVGVEPAALGIGIPGIVDIHRGVTHYLPNLPTHWHDIAVRDILEKKVGCPVHIINDVKAATLGEMVFGLGKDVKSMVFLAIGTGIGGGVMINGRLNLGKMGSAGELGHMVVERDGPFCGCGSRGCLETFVSGPALTAEAIRLLLSGQAPFLFEMVEGNTSRVDPRMIGQAAEKGEDSLRLTIRRAGYYLGLAISQLIVALEPEIIVIGGGVAGLGDPLFDSVRQTIRDTVKIYPAEDFRIEPSTVGEGAGLMGTLALAMRGGRTER